MSVGHIDNYRFGLGSLVTSYGVIYVVNSFPGVLAPDGTDALWYVTEIRETRGIILRQSEMEPTKAEDFHPSFWSKADNKR